MIVKLSLSSGYESINLSNVSKEENRYEYNDAVNTAHQSLKRERSPEEALPDRKFTKAETSLKAGFISHIGDRLIEAPRPKEYYTNLLEEYERQSPNIENFKNLSEIISQIPDQYIDDKMFNLICRACFNSTKTFYKESQYILFNTLEKIPNEINLERPNYFKLLTLCSQIDDPLEKIEQLSKIISKFKRFRLDEQIINEIYWVEENSLAKDLTAPQISILMLDLIEKNSISLSNSMFHVLIKKFSRAKDRESTLRCYEIMKQKKIQPSVTTFSSLFWVANYKENIKEELVKTISLYKVMWKSQIVPNNDVIKAIRVICGLPSDPQALKNIQDPTLYCFELLCKRMLDLSRADGDNEGIWYAIKEMEWAKIPIPKSLEEDIRNKLNAKDAFISECAQFKSIKNPDYHSLERILTQYKEMVNRGIIPDQTVEEAIKNIGDLQKIDNKVEDLKNDPTLYCLGILGQKMLGLSISQHNSEGVWKIAMELNSVKISLKGSSDFVLNKLKVDNQYASYELPLRCELFQLFNEEIESKK